jgi:hypothetical protein
MKKLKTIADDRRQGQLHGNSCYPASALNNAMKKEKNS